MFLLYSFFGWCCCFFFSCSVVLPSFSSFGWGLRSPSLLFGGVAFLPFLWVVGAFPLSSVGWWSLVSSFFESGAVFSFSFWWCAPCFLLSLFLLWVVLLFFFLLFGGAAFLLLPRVCGASLLSSVRGCCLVFLLPSCGVVLLFFLLLLVHCRMMRCTALCVEQKGHTLRARHRADTRQTWLRSAVEFFSSAPCCGAR